jgi:hypothetical protein
VSSLLAGEEETEYVVIEDEPDLIVNQPGVAAEEAEDIFPSLSAIHDTLEHLQKLAPDFYSAVQQCINDSGVSTEHHDAIAIFTSVYLLPTGADPGSADFAAMLSNAFESAVFMCESLRESMQDENDPVIIGNALTFAAYSIMSEQEIDPEALISLARAKAVKIRQGWNANALFNYGTELFSRGPTEERTPFSALPKGLQKLYIEYMYKRAVQKRGDCPSDVRSALYSDIFFRMRKSIEENGGDDMTSGSINMIIQIVINEALDSRYGPASDVQNEDNNNNSNNNNNNAG